MMLDEQKDDLVDMDFPKDINSFSFGSIAGHNIVIAGFQQTGGNMAAAVESARLDISSNVGARMDLYKRLPLDKTKSEIRLFCLTSCEPPSPSSGSSRPQLAGFLGVVRLEGRHRRRLPYRAVSYVWGEPTLSDTLVLNDGYRLAVTPTVVDALSTFWLHAGPQPVARGRGWGDSEELSDGDLGAWSLEDEPQALLRDPPGMLFWVDQVCIDQRNGEERGHQVGLMSKVYSWAWRTLVWLGQVEHLQHQSRFKVAYSHLLMERFRALDDEPDDITMEDLMVLLSSTWFTRIWVVQEFVLSHHVSLFYGSFRIPRKFIADLADIFKRLSSTYMLYCMPARLQSSLRNCHAMISLRYLGGKPSLFDVLYAQSLCSEFNCTDPHDRVYALLGFLRLGEELPFQPDYDSTVAEAYRMLAAASLKQGLIVKLLAFAGLQEPGDGGGSDDYIPSWCPTHRTTKSTSKYLRMQMTWDSSGPRVQHQAGSDELRIWGKIDGEAVENAGLVVDGSRYGASVLDIINWILELSISSPGCGNKSTSEFALDTLARLMSFDSSLSFPFVSLEAFKDWHNFVNVYQSSSRCFSFASGEQPTQQSARQVTEAASKVGDYGTFFQDAIHDHRLCLTTAGRFGVFPRLSRIGDVIAVISGLSLPLVLRPVAGEGGQYMLVGAAFVLDFPKLPYNLAENDFTWVVLV
ncbi:heterokaryon incompatibility protein-domain-containing protein [Stachybotrys elegans]|uniref:Heterokaryon incompatibility protein-domain-containing protein n=1 Tax=Stachybotrys elegans TaxID=80388 RepID=A0A8K0SD13_9HYPO|nr:heterokaryon incompatibility protein-domain-containing protein [Stachybotrys elegans]